MSGPSDLTDRCLSLMYTYHSETKKFETFTHGYLLLKHGYVLFKHGYVLLKHGYVLLKVPSKTKFHK